MLGCDGKLAGSHSAADAIRCVTCTHSIPVIVLEAVVTIATT